MKKKDNNPGAGLGDPYWYEWSIGLGYVIDMLIPNSEIAFVTLQKSGSKGLDDVVVHYKNGHARFIQVKHSRVDNNLTFGDLVSAEDEGHSLLRQMADAWVSVGKPNEVQIVTNRIAGSKSSTSKKNGNIKRPPLDKFLNWLSGELTDSLKLDDLKPESEWQDAWDKEWLKQLDDLEEADKIQFLKAFEIIHSQKGLVEVTEELTDRLASLFSVEINVAHALRSRLDSALRRWATSDRGPLEKIFKEDVYEKLCLAEDSLVGEHDLAPPSPFFPTRRDILYKCESLLSMRAKPVVFITGEPGSGKTALISEIANQRNSIINARFHAYRPITPENQLLPADSGKTTSARALWSDLLIQIRSMARGRLDELNVPIHAGSLSVESLRAQVLRLANELGKTGTSVFVIAVDGIDHAARAGNSSESFLSSLIPPDQIPENVTFLIGGQPPAAYPLYPSWLRSNNLGVEIIELPRLTSSDVQVLVDERLSNVSNLDREIVTRDIFIHCEGHTLSTMFAIEEAVLVEDDLSLFPSRIGNRQLSSGLEGYYDLIWSDATKELLAPSAIRLGACLILSPARLTGEMMATVTKSGKTSAAEWTDRLRALRPLVLEEENGFRFFHNDIRVFLVNLISRESQIYQECASSLADYLLLSEDAAARHNAVQNLFGIANRFRDQALMFTPKYVLEGHAIGQSTNTLTEQGIIAAEALSLIDEDWEAVHIVAMGLRTLEQLRKSLDSRGTSYQSPNILGISVPRTAERGVPSLEKWSSSVVMAALFDIDELISLGQIDRARDTFVRWFKDLCPHDVDFRIRDSSSRYNEDTREVIRHLGRVSCALLVFLKVSEGEESGDSEANYSKGLLEVLTKTESPKKFVLVLHRIKYFYHADIVYLLLLLAEQRDWKRCGFLLQYFQPPQKEQWAFRISGALVSAIIGESELHAKWVAPVLESVRLSLEAAVTISHRPSYGIDRLDVMSWMSMLIAIDDPNRHASGIREEIEQALSQTNWDERKRSYIAQINYASALLGSLIHTSSKGLPNALHVDKENVLRIVKIIVETSNNGKAGFLLPLGYEKIAVLLVQGFLDCMEDDHEIHKSIVQLFLGYIQKGEFLGGFLDTAWHLLKSSGKKNELIKYAETWLGADGFAWEMSQARRYSMVSLLAKLLDDIEEVGMSESVLERLAWAEIGYVDHKEYALDRPLEWFRLIVEDDPVIWGKEGMRLFAISREASLKGDNRMASDIESNVIAAACSMGPNEIAKLLKSSEAGIEPGDRNVISGLKEMIKNKSSSRHDLLCAWAFVSGQLCWQLSEDRGIFSQISEEILDAARRESYSGFSEDLRLMGGFDFFSESEERNQEPATNNTYSTLKLSKLPELLEDKAALGQWGDVADLLHKARNEGSRTFSDVVSKVLPFLIARQEQVWWSDGVGKVYRAVFSSLTPNQRWSLIIQAVTDTSYSDLSIRSSILAENLDDFCRLAATIAGKTELQKGLIRHLEMHELWISGAGHLKRITLPALASEEFEYDWDSLFIELLVGLLEYDEQSYVEASLRGIFRLLKLNSSLYSSTIQLVKNSDLIVQRRFLMIGDAIASYQPLQQEFREWLIELIDSNYMDMALSAWSILRTSSRVHGEPYTKWPEPTSDPPAIVPVAPPLVVRNVTQTGLMLNSPRVSTSILRYLKIACDDKLEDLESTFAASVRKIDLTDEARRIRVSVSRDLLADRKADKELNCLFKVIREYDRKGRFRLTPPIRLAQALLPASDPFVFLEMPKIHGSLEEWPFDLTLEKEIESEPIVTEKLVSLLVSDLPKELVALGGEVQTYSKSRDVKVAVQYSFGRKGKFKDEGPEFMLNPRSSLFFEDFSDFVIGNRSRNRHWLTMKTWGLFPFADALVECFPTELWYELGWKPISTNPLSWERNGEIVLWYEKVRGPLRDIYPNDLLHRQPSLSRWICKKTEWDRFTAMVGTPSRHVFFDSANFK